MASPAKPKKDNASLLELYKQARDNLEATQQELSDAQTHIAIRAAAARRAATAAEKAQMDTLYDKEVAISALARGFSQQMSQSDQLKQLTANLKDITAGLQKTLDELQHIAKVADTASQAARLSQQARPRSNRPRLITATCTGPFVSSASRFALPARLCRLHRRP